MVSSIKELIDYCHSSVYDDALQGKTPEFYNKLKQAEKELEALGIRKSKFEKIGFVMSDKVFSVTKEVIEDRMSKEVLERFLRVIDKESLSLLVTFALELTRVAIEISEA